MSLGALVLSHELGNRESLRLKKMRKMKRVYITSVKELADDKFFGR